MYLEAQRESRADGDGHRIQVLLAYACLLQGRGNGCIHGGLMRLACQVWHHAAPWPMDLPLRVDNTNTFLDMQELL